MCEVTQNPMISTVTQNTYMVCVTLHSGSSIVFVNYYVRKHMTHVYPNTLFNMQFAGGIKLFKYTAPNLEVNKII